MTTSLADINAQVKKCEEQVAQLRKQAEELRHLERAGVVEELRKKIAEYGLTASDLRLSTRGGVSASKRQGGPAVLKAEAKYRSENGETWSGGRGRKPRWVTEVLAAGKSLDDYAIK